jgi:hypothetical protein
MPIAQLVIWVLSGAAVVGLAVYATYLFGHRLRCRDESFKSFGVWLRDLFDIASGVG